MSNPKGTAFETDMVRYVKLWRPQTERRARNGKNDRGDLFIPGEERFIIECKNHKAMKLADWVEQARLESANAGVPYGVVLHKRRGTRVQGEQYITMPFFAFMGLMYGDPIETGA